MSHRVEIYHREGYLLGTCEYRFAMHQDVVFFHKMNKRVTPVSWTVNGEDDVMARREVQQVALRVSERFFVDGKGLRRSVAILVADRMADAFFTPEFEPDADLEESMRAALVDTLAAEVDRKVAQIAAARLPPVPTPQTVTGKRLFDLDEDTPQTDPQV